jgi:hypothetical protein
VACAQLVALRVDNPVQRAAEEHRLKHMADELRSQSDAASIMSDQDVLKYSATRRMSLIELQNLVMDALVRNETWCHYH